MTGAGNPRALVVDNGSRSTGLIVRLLGTYRWSVTVMPVTEIPAVVPRTSAILLTGTDVPVWHSLYRAEIGLIRSCPVPLLGICGGHQLIGRAYGTGLARTPPVVGRTRVRLRSGVPLFDGVPAEVDLFERHIYGLETVPDGFDPIATSDACPVEGIRHRRRALYGMQAHLEFRPHGREILRNFLDLACAVPPVQWAIREHRQYIESGA